MSVQPVCHSERVEGSTHSPGAGQERWRVGTDHIRPYGETAVRWSGWRVSDEIGAKIPPCAARSGGQVDGGEAQPGFFRPPMVSGDR